MSRKDTYKYSVQISQIHVVLLYIDIYTCTCTLMDMYCVQNKLHVGKWPTAVWGSSAQYTPITVHVYTYMYVMWVWVNIISGEHNIRQAHTVCVCVSGSKDTGNTVVSCQPISTTRAVCLPREKRESRGIDMKATCGTC